eukprot:m.242561 g.242561  ORF g.242561 m.242561 type:complete len:155 (-) comp25857_c0_seq1:244-708(-)
MGQDLSVESLSYLAPAGPNGAMYLHTPAVSQQLQPQSQELEQQTPQSKAIRQPLQDMNSAAGKAIGMSTTSATTTAATNSPNDSPVNSAQLRVVMVGAQVHSQEHFSRWLGESEDPMKSVRSPSRHYTSMSRSTRMRSYNSCSEGNRFILDDEL